MTSYQLFWLRELPGGALGGEYGEMTTSLAHLPINETIAGRIRALSPPDSEVGLFFPFLNHRDRMDWPAQQLKLAVTAYDYDRIVVGDEAEHQFASLLAAPALVGGSAPIFFRDERVWKASDWDTAIVPMLTAHRIKLDPAWKPSGPVRLRWTIGLPHHLAPGWACVPHRRDARFLDQFRGVSTSLQIAMRSWLPYQYFSQPERYGRPQFAHPYMVYGTLPPHPSRRKTQLTFHVLEPQRVVRSMKRLGKPLVEQLRRAQARMEAGGIEPRSEYKLDQAAEIARSMYGLPRTFGGLLSLEAFVVEEFVRFATAAHELRTAPRRARLHAEPGLDLLHRLRCRLSRSHGGETFANLVNLILVAATAGLGWRDTPEGALVARVVATEIETGREIRGASRFSYANF